MNSYSTQAMQRWENLSPKKHVTVDYELLSLRAKADAMKDFFLPKWDNRGVHPAAHKSFPSHCFWHNVVNFCFSYSTVDEDGLPEKFTTVDIFGNVQTGSYGMGACFYRAFGEAPIMASGIQKISEQPKRTEAFFNGKKRIPMLNKRRQFLLEASNILEEKYRGDPINLLESGRYRAFGSFENPGIVDLLIRDFPTVFGSDRVQFNSDFMDFLKRAQLFVLEYHGRAIASGGILRSISDVEEIGPIVDYQIPRFYRSAGILNYSDELSSYIYYRDPIPSKSIMEIELRGATLYAFFWELLIINHERKNASLPIIHVGHLDFDRWMQARAVREPHHLCRTTDY